jgi:hypothetical protein
MTNPKSFVIIIYSFREGLKQIVTNIEEQVRSHLPFVNNDDRSTSHSHSRSYDSHGKR